MKIYKTRWFKSWADDQGLSDISLRNAINEMISGLYEADLGSGLLKKRVARMGQGKSGGFRTLIASNKADKWFFVFGFSKNERSNISKKEEKALKKLANQLLLLSPQDLLKAEQHNELKEITYD